jgi:hypothetical protein
MTFVFFFGFQVTLYAEPYPLESFASISVPDGINLGNISEYGQQTFNSTIKAHITANCPHHIGASIGAFANPKGGLIPKEKTSVEMTPPLSSPRGTPPQGVDVDINLKFTIDIESSDLAGEYTGSLVLTVMAGL